MTALLGLHTDQAFLIIGIVIIGCVIWAIRPEDDD